MNKNKSLVTKIISSNITCGECYRTSIHSFPCIKCKGIMCRLCVSPIKLKKGTSNYRLSLCKSCSMKLYFLEITFSGIEKSDNYISKGPLSRAEMQVPYVDIYGTCMECNEFILTTNNTILVDSHNCEGDYTISEEQYKNLDINKMVSDVKWDKEYGQ